MSKIITTYQNCKYIYLHTRYVGLYRHTIYIYISAYQVCRNIYRHTKNINIHVYIKRIYVRYVDNNIKIPKLTINISKYQVCQNIYRQTKYIEIYIEIKTKLCISIPSMSTFYYEYEHTKYFSTYFNIPSMS